MAWDLSCAMTSEAQMMRGAWSMKNSKLDHVRIAKAHHHEHRAGKRFAMMPRLKSRGRRLTSGRSAASIC